MCFGHPLHKSRAVDNCNCFTCVNLSCLLEEPFIELLLHKGLREHPSPNEIETACSLTLSAFCVGFRENCLNYLNFFCLPENLDSSRHDHDSLFKRKSFVNSSYMKTHMSPMFLLYHVTAFSLNCCYRNDITLCTTTAVIVKF